MSTTPRVLLVEDEAGLRLTLTDRLGSEGYSVETASDGESGLARAASMLTQWACVSGETRVGLRERCSAERL